jgi:hypothetical protein
VSNIGYTKGAANSYVAGASITLTMPVAVNFVVQRITAAMQYAVVRQLDVQGVSDTLGETASSYGTNPDGGKRIRFVQPDNVLITINSVSYILPGYYLCVALGTMRAAFPPHQGFTTLGLAGIDQIYNANKKFNDDQLDAMAGNGVFWILQDDITTLPYVMYQTTCSTDSVLDREDSCVATIDYASKFYKGNLKSVLGKYNVNDISTKYVTQVINSCTEKMQRMTYPFIGPLLISGSLTALTVADDRIKPVVSIVGPKPVNGVDLYLEVE